MESVVGVISLLPRSFKMPVFRLFLKGKPFSTPYANRLKSAWGILTARVFARAVSSVSFQLGDGEPVNLRSLRNLMCAGEGLGNSRKNRLEQGGTCCLFWFRCANIRCPPPPADNTILEAVDSLGAGT